MVFSNNLIMKEIEDLFEIRLFCMEYALGNVSIESDLRCMNPLTHSPEVFY